MEDQNTLVTSSPKHQPWNKGRFTGAKPPLHPKHVWSIRSKLQAEGSSDVKMHQGHLVHCNGEGRVATLSLIECCPDFVGLNVWTICST